MNERHAFRAASIAWAIYALVTTLPVLSYPSLLVPATIRAALGLAIAWFFWSRPGRGIAILGTVLSLGFVPLTLIAVTGGLNVGPLYIAVAAVGFACFITSAYSWWLFTRRVEPRAS